MIMKAELSLSLSLCVPLARYVETKQVHHSLVGLGLEIFN